MENFYNSQISALEADSGTEKPSTTSNPQIKVMSKDGDAYYVMLNTGLVVDTANHHFNKTLFAAYTAGMPAFSKQPNQNLLNQFAQYLHQLKIPHARVTLSIKPFKQRVVIWEMKFPDSFRPVTVMLASDPTCGKSYMKATVLKPNSDWQQVHSFIAQSPIIIYQRLTANGLLKKGGSHD